MNPNLFNIIVILIYACIMIFVATVMFWLTIQRRKNADAMRRNIYSKMTSGIKLTAKDIANIGKSFDLTAFQSRKVIYKIFRETETKEEFENLKALVQEIETEEPFDEMPEEVKPSLARITKIIDNSSEDSDKKLLSPILAVLSKYVEQKDEQKKLKRQTNIAYIITVISFFIGTISFYYTFTSPNAKDIAKEIQATVKQQTIEHGMQNNSD